MWKRKEPAIDSGHADEAPKAALNVPAWNRRQLHKRAFPRYAAHVSDFVCQHS